MLRLSVESDVAVIKNLINLTREAKCLLDSALDLPIELLHK